MSWTVAQLAGFCGGRVSGDPDVRIGSVSTDTRSLAPGALFVAIAGENFDGHDYVAQALESGARAVLISHDLPDLPVPTLSVDDTVAALGDMARGHRASFRGPVVAITGSNGKTTTKELCAGILQAAGVRVRRTRGNLNNHIGMPLTVLELSDDDEVLVVEMGMNHEGEIAHLARIAAPTVGAITNVAPAHLGPLGSIEAIARAKGELFAGLPADATAIVNLDDARCVAQADRHAGARLGFGSDANAEIRGTAEEPDDGRCVFQLDTPRGGTRIALRAPGLHLMEDALCAAAAAFATGLLGERAVEAIRDGLEGFEGVPGRLAVQRAPGGLTLIDDSYNANPPSTRTALRTLARMRGDGRAIAVLGDMLELGEEEAALHEAIGHAAAEAGVDRLVGVGPLSRNTVRGATAAGIEATHADDAEQAAAQVRGLAKSGDVILIKGSRGMAMERVVAALVEEPA